MFRDEICRKIGSEHSPRWHHYSALEVRDGGYRVGIGPKLRAFFSDRNLLLCPLGSTIYVMPPYCVTAADLKDIYAAVSDAADTLI
jgi:adenosylmethionine---8-amino-7-oxononanoate aminotransferase